MVRRRFGSTGRYAIKSIIRSMAEKKVWDGADDLLRDGLAVDAAGTLINMALIPQGNTSESRIGDKVTGSSIQLNVFGYNPGYRIDDGPPVVVYQPIRNLLVRLIVFIWKDDTAPVLGDLLDVPGGISPEEGIVMAPLNHDRKVKRKILHDKTYNLYSDTISSFMPAIGGVALPPTGVYKPTLMLRLVFDLTKLKGGLNTINYSGTDNTSGINRPYALLISNTTNSAGPPIRNYNWDFAYTFRYTFIDV